MSKVYVIWDSRPGNEDYALFWRPDGLGYTSNLAEAGRFDDKGLMRPTDILVPLEVAEKLAKLCVDVDDLRSAVKDLTTPIRKGPHEGS